MTARRPGRPLPQPCEARCAGHACDLVDGAAGDVVHMANRAPELELWRRLAERPN